jgi:ubiquitin C-terminal hydrolase
LLQDSDIAKSPKGFHENRANDLCIPSDRFSSASEELSASTLTGPSQKFPFQTFTAASPPCFLVARYKPKTPIWSLVNPGNLCFLNSLLQNLARLAPLMVWLETSQAGTRSLSADDTTLASTFDHFCLKVNSNGTKSMMAAKTIECLRLVLPDLVSPIGSGNQRQQDAHEVLLRLLDKLDSEGRSAGRCYFNIFVDNPTYQFGHQLPALCTGLLEQETSCSRCAHRGSHQETFLCLSIPIPMQSEMTVAAIMAAYFARTQVKFRCSVCDETTAWTQQRVLRWPTVLVVHFLRWRGASKISSIIKVPTTLSAPEDDDGSQYKLNGYILHHGPQANAGHYSAVVKVCCQSSDEYFSISDDRFSDKAIDRQCYSVSGFPSNTCYLAFYVKYHNVDSLRCS